MPLGAGVKIIEGKENMTVSIGLSCIIMLAVLAGLALAVSALNKRIDPSSWFRRILAVIAGVIIFFGGYVAAGVYFILLGYGTTMMLSAQNFSSDEIQARLQSELGTSSLSLLVSTIVFYILFSLLGGYAAGKIVRRNEIVYGFATGISAFLVFILFISLVSYINLASSAPGPFWQSKLSIVVIIGSATLGGCLAFICRKRERATQVEIGET